MKEWEKINLYWDLRYLWNHKISKSQRALIKWWNASPLIRESELDRAIAQLVKFYS